MTVQTNTNVASFNGNGVTQIFPIAFKFNNATDLVVLLVEDATGAAVRLTLNSDYTVSGEGDEEGGLINVVVAPAVGSRLLATRVVDILQMTDLRNQGKFFAEVHEDAFDLLTMIAQQHQSDIARSLRVAETDPEPARIPPAVLRAGKLLAFDNDGNPTTALPVEDSSTELRQELANNTPYLVDGSVVGVDGESLVDRLDRLAVVNTVGDGVADDWAVLQAALNTGRPHMFGGNCRVSRELVAPASGAYLIGLPGAVIDGSEAGFTGSAVISASGSLSAIPAPSGALAEGAQNVSFAAAHGLVAGDVFCLWNPSGTSWSSFRTNYFAGEWCKVEQVISATEVLLTSRLYDSYAAGVLESHKLNAVPVDLRGFKVKGASSANAVSIVCGTGSIDLDVTHANNAAVSISRSYDVKVSGSTFNTGSGGDDYGIAISNSQRVRVYGRHHSRRHAVTHGGGVGAGSVPCRDSRVIGSTLSNDMTSGVHSADFHGNSEDCYFVDCNISGGGSLQGKNTGFINCRISNMLAGHVIQAAEIVGGKFVLHNCELVSTTNPTSGSRGVIQFDGGVTAETKERVLFAICNSRVRARNMATNTYLARFTVRGSTVPVDFDFNGLDFDVDNMGTVLFTTYASGTALSNGISILGLSGNLPAGCILHNTAANAYLNSPQRLPKQTGSEVVTTSTTANTASGAAKTFRYTYPRVPVVSVTTSERGFIGGVSPNASAIPVSATGLTPVLFTPNATNFSVSTTVRLNWSAELSEF